MAREELKLVTDFASLRVGMLVAIKPCLRCGATYRFMLLRPVAKGEMIRHRTGLYRAHADGWVDTDDHSECHDPVRHILTADAVEERRLYRVVDGLEAPAETTKVRKPIKVDR